MTDHKLEIVKEQRRTKQLVRDILKENPIARNNDLILCLMIWQEKQQIKIVVPQDKIREMIMPETISRCRREVQNNDYEFLPTDPNVMIARGIKEEVLRAYYSTNQVPLKAFMEKKYGIM